MKNVIKLLIVNGDSLIFCVHWSHLDFRCLSEHLSTISQRTCVRSVRCMMSLWENCSFSWASVSVLLLLLCLLMGL